MNFYKDLFSNLISSVRIYHKIIIAFLVFLIIITLIPTSNFFELCCCLHNSNLLGVNILMGLAQSLFTLHVILTTSWFFTFACFITIISFVLGSLINITTERLEKEENL